MGFLITLPKLTKQEMERIEEIKFYFFTSKLTKSARGAGLNEEYDIVRYIFEALHLDENLMFAAISTINSIACRPSEMEVAVTCKYLKLPTRYIEKYIMNNRKFYKNCLEYKEQKNELGEMLPKMPVELTDIVCKFNKEFKEKLSPIFKFLDTEPTLGNNESWDS